LNLGKPAKNGFSGAILRDRSDDLGRYVQLHDQLILEKASMGRYAIATGQRDKDRLDLLAGYMRPHTTRLLDAVGVEPGWRCFDAGCGAGPVSFELARRVGPHGRVIGVDLGEEILELARLRAKEQGLDNVEFSSGDARSPAGGPYDLIHARFLLSHLDDPAVAVAGLAGTLAPGGVLVVVDTDFAHNACPPVHPALARYVEVYRETLRRRGGDADLGGRLPGLLLDAGLEGVQVDVAQPVLFEGEAKMLYTLTMENMTESIVGEEVASAAEVAELVAELRTIAEDPRQLVALPYCVQAWGYASGSG
jgi:SAM-dependent methyltransferase